MKIKLKKDDVVQVIAGKDRVAGKTGRIIRVDRKNGKVIVQGVNMAKKALRRKNQQDKGGIADVEMPLDVSNVAIVCKKCGPTRIAIDVEGKSKVRKCKKCGEVL